MKETQTFLVNSTSFPNIVFGIMKHQRNTTYTDEFGKNNPKPDTDITQCVKFLSINQQYSKGEVWRNFMQIWQHD